MNTCARSGKTPHADHTKQREQREQRGFRLAPIAQAIALVLAAGGTIGNAHAAAAFSPSWFAQKASIQNTVAATGRLPDGRPVSSLSGSQQAQQANQTLAKSIADLGLAARGIAFMQSQQAAGAGANVPDGLVAGGLAVDTNSLTAAWINAGRPTESVDSNGNVTVDVKQTDQRAVLSWQSFNIGKNTTLDFDQGGNRSWTVLNKINDPSGVPSQILGRIKADGQVLVIDHNGIVFGGGSQINVYSLIASSLDLQPNVSANNYQLFLQNGLFQSPVPVVPTGLTGAGAAIFVADPAGAGAVTVEPGAQIDTTGKLSPTGDGGYVALIGSSVENGGTITTQNGQIILAADSTVTLVTPTSSATGVNTALQVIAGVGAVTNDLNGLLISNDGAVTLAGGDINQLGGIAVTTSVTRPGSISLAASDNVVLGANSITTIVPDETSGTLPTAIVDSTVQDSLGNTVSYFQGIVQPKIDIEAGDGVDMKGGALIEAPSAALTMGAGLLGSGSSQGTVLLESGANIDLAGLADVTLPISVNEISILITQAEVADDPLARSLIGQTVTVDAGLSGTRADGFQWVGSPILDAAGYVGLIPQSIDQIFTAGGSFKSSGLNVIQQQGASIDVSGGYVHYLGGLFKTTVLRDQFGNNVPIGQADPNDIFVGIAGQFISNHPRWGVSETYQNALIGAAIFEDDYIAGASAGAIGVTAITPILEGDLVADIVTGDRQRAMVDTSNAASLNQMPSGASLSITFAKPGPGIGNLYDVVLAPQANAGTDPYGADDFSFDTASSWSPTLTGNAFPVFSDLLSGASFGAISIKGAQQLDMPAGATLSVAPGGSITLDGVATIDGTLSAHAGKISLTGFTYASDAPQQPSAPALVIGPDALLDVSGLWVNDAGQPEGRFAGSAFTNGGSVSISTIAASNMTASTGSGDGTFVDVTQSIVLAPGSVIDVSGGGYVGITGQLKIGSDGLPVGQGGSVALMTYVSGSEPQIWGSASPFGDKYNVLPHGVNPDGSINTPNQANVVLDGTIYAQGFDGGGTFALQVPNVVIDGTATQVTSTISNAVAAEIAGQSELPAAAFAHATVSDDQAGQMVLPTDFFDSGFGQYTVTASFDDAVVTAGTQVAPRQTSLLADGGAAQIPSGAMARSFASAGFLPDGVRKPVSLTLDAPTVLVDSGAAITVDPQGSVSLVGNDQLTVLGSIVAPGGAINLIAGTLWIGSDALLDVSGVFVPDPRVAAFTTGSVLDGGTITLDGQTVVAEAGSQFRLEGAAATIDNGPNDGQIALWSDGGNLQLGGSSIYFAGSVDAAGGAPLASGGTLTVGDVLVPDAVKSLVLSSTGTFTAGTIVIGPDGFVGANLPTLSTLSGQPQPADLAAIAALAPGGFTFLGTDTLNNSGFDAIALTSDAIDFRGSVHIAIPGALTMTATGGKFVLLPSGDGLLPAGVATSVNNDARGTYTPASCGTDCVPDIGAPVVDIDAGYVQLVGGLGITQGDVALPTLADGTFNITAQWIDLERQISLHNAGEVNLTSSGAIRLLDNNGLSGAPAILTAYAGALIVPGNLTLKAAEIYPVSNMEYMLASTGTSASDSTITIEPNGTPAAPLSAGGGILVNALSIVQNGVLWAPLGGIVLGLQDPSQIPAVFTPVFGNTVPFVATENVTLGAGSLTSVSAAGLDIPDGYTIDGATWYQGYTPAPEVSGLPAAMTAPPAKSIGLYGANIATNAGAVIDASGGGDIYATEYVAGTGGSRNVLATYQQGLSSTSYAAQYPDGRQVYALVPTYEAKVAAYDPDFADAPYYSGLTAPAGTALTGFDPHSNDFKTPFGNIAPGTSITIAGGNGIPAGTYTLMPGMYATMPGAYRVVQTASNLAPGAATDLTSLDGSQYISGYVTNALTGARSAQQSLFQVQSGAVWNQYSDIKITSGSVFFNNQAVNQGVSAPPLPVDGGLLTLGANKTLSLNGSNDFAAGTSNLAPDLVGAGGQIAISADNILILSAGQSAPTQNPATPYLMLDADQISNLGATTVLIGGTAAFDSTGEVITAKAHNVEILTDDAHPLTGPDLIFASLAPDAADPDVHGITVDDGSVIRAVGAVPIASDRHITIGALPVLQGDNVSYAGQASGDGSLLRVSNGTPIAVTRLYVPGLYDGPGPAPASAVPLGQIALGTAPGSTGFTADASVTITGTSVTIDSSGASVSAPGAVIKAQNYDLSASIINIGGGNDGLVLAPAMIANFADATEVTLRSSSVINFYDAGNLQIGDALHPIGTLTLDASGLFSEGGATTLDAANVRLTNSQATQNLNGKLTGTGAGGMLTINAGIDSGAIFAPDGNVVFDAGAKSLGGFSQFNVNASQAIGFSGAGSLDAGAAAMQFAAPQLVVNAGATQSLTSTGAAAILVGAGTASAVDAANIGGAMSLTAASIVDSGVIVARSGNVSLTASAGDLDLANGAAIDATGSHIAILDLSEDAPGGSVRLVSQAGNVTLEQGSDVNVSGTGMGFGGNLAILTGPDQTATLNGTLEGGAAYKDMGGNFQLQTGNLAGDLPWSGFTGSFAVRLGHGDIVVDAGRTLSSTDVLLEADDGSVIVNGVIDASGASGGTIALYGAGTTAGGITTGGVTVNAGGQLIAAYAADDPNDPASGNGSANLAQNGGVITLGTTGVWDGVSLNADGSELIATNSDNTASASGKITVAAGALLDVSGGAAGVGGIVNLRAPITTFVDSGTGTPSYFANVAFNGTVKGTTDGAGQASGQGVALNAYAVWSATDGSTGADHFDGIIDPAGWFDDNGVGLSGTDQNGNAIANAPTPDNPLQTGQIFQVDTPNADHVGFYQNTLVDFVQDFSLANAGDFSGVANMHLRPEIDLVNPSSTINDGNITVASNWNLGANGDDVSGNIRFSYRTATGEPGVLSLRAINNVQINASISDGFYVTAPPPVAANAAAAYAQLIASADYTAYEEMFSAGALIYSGSVSNLLDPTLPVSAPASAAFFDISDAQFNALQFHLQAPTVMTGNAPSVIDQYDQYYIQYAGMYQAYQTEIVDDSTKAASDPSLGVGTGFGGYTSYDAVMAEAGVTAPAIPVAPTLTTGSYYNIQTGAQPGTGADYVSQWENYFFGIIDANLQATSHLLGAGPGSLSAALNGKPLTLANATGLDVPFCVLCFAFTPPSAPPAYLTLQPGYVASPPPSAPLAPPANQIANNPAMYQGQAIYNATAAAELMPAGYGGSKGSFSYNFTAGADVSNPDILSANPNAVIALSTPVAATAPTDSVTIDGHTSYVDTLAIGPSSGQPLIIDIPTLVRTGTGAITLTAAGDVEFLDTVTPGAVYTAGEAVSTPSDFNAPIVPAGYNTNSNGLVSTPAWATGGGAVTIDAGQSIIGVETPTDDASGSQDNVDNGPTGQMWSDWYVHSGQANGSPTPFANCATGGDACQTAAWVNYATFFQAFGALGGGNIALTAGGDITDIGASLPETIVVSGGFTANDPPKENYYGGGNLLVRAGGDLDSSDFLVGRGAGVVQIGGAVQATAVNPITGLPTLGRSINGSGAVTGTYALPLLLAVQDGFVTVAARGSVTLGNVYDPASLLPGGYVQTNFEDLPGGDSSIWGTLFTSYGPNSGVSLTSTTGDITALTISSDSGNRQYLGLFTHNDASNPGNSSNSAAIGLLLPATLDLAALSGNVALNDQVNARGVVLNATNANLLPYPTQSGDDTGTISIVAGQSINLGDGISMPDLGVGAVVGHTSFADYDTYISPLGIPLANLTQAMHANDPAPVVIAAGKDIDASGTLSLLKPAQIEAGRDIGAGNFMADQLSGSLTFIGENNNPDDITTISAGRDIIGGSYALYGPGDFVVQAGRDLGPFGSGIASLGNGSDVGATFPGLPSDALKPYLPSQGADISVRFGVGPGVDYASAISQYVDPAHAGADGIDFLADIAASLGVSPDQAWSVFQGLPAARQQILVNRAFLDFLTQVATDFSNPSSQYHGQYGRAYQAIATLFPAAYGYTDNTGGGSTDGAAATINTGNMNIAASLLETQMGGDINIIGPGGGITVGHTSTDILKPNQEGILTLAGGTIRAFTDSAILLNQSRIMTQQGGDIDLFSANGDISAGAGPKTYVSDPPISELCTIDGYCTVNPQGLVSGAGIGAVVTLPGQDPTLSNVTLVAPHGTVDAGSAGIRVAGNLNIVAAQVLNAYNIQVQGTELGVPEVAPVNIGALTNAGAAASQAAMAAQDVVNRDRNAARQALPSIFTVRVLGFGNDPAAGDSGADQAAPAQSPADLQTSDLRYDPKSPLQIVARGGDLYPEQASRLTDEQRRRLRQDR
jgi:filamentous hemagglutinin family protein